MIGKAITDIFQFHAEQMEAIDTQLANSSLRALIASDQQSAAARQRDRLWEMKAQIEYVFGRAFFWRMLAWTEERCHAWNDERYLDRYGRYPP